MESDDSKIVGFKLMPPMSNIGCFNFFMWTVNIYVEANFARCTKSPTDYTRESNQYPCHLPNTQKKEFHAKRVKSWKLKKEFLIFIKKSSILYLTGLWYASDMHKNKLYNGTTIFLVKNVKHQNLTSA